MIDIPVPAAVATGTGTSLSPDTEVESAKRDTSPGWAMAGIETAVETARRYIIKRPRLTRLLDNANARVLMLNAPAGFGKTTLAREWVLERPHLWYRGTTATADVAALAAQLADVVSELIPDAGSRMVHRMRATGTPEQDVDILAELFAEDLADWPDETWLVFDDYQFAMEAEAPERFMNLSFGNRRSGSCWQAASGRAGHPLGGSFTARFTSWGGTSWRWITTRLQRSSPTVRMRRRRSGRSGRRLAGRDRPGGPDRRLRAPGGQPPRRALRVLRRGALPGGSPKVREGLCRLALAPSLGDGWRSSCWAKTSRRSSPKECDSAF